MLLRRRTTRCRYKKTPGPGDATVSIVPEEGNTIVVSESSFHFNGQKSFRLHDGHELNFAKVLSAEVIEHSGGDVKLRFKLVDGRTIDGVVYAELVDGVDDNLGNYSLTLDKVRSLTFHR